MDELTLEQVIIDARRVKELNSQGLSIKDIIKQLELQESYVNNILLCAQAYPEDNEIAVAHLIMLG